MISPITISYELVKLNLPCILLIINLLETILPQQRFFANIFFLRCGESFH